MKLYLLLLKTSTRYSKKSDQFQYFQYKKSIITKLLLCEIVTRGQNTNVRLLTKKLLT